MLSSVSSVPSDVHSPVKECPAPTARMGAGAVPSRVFSSSAVDGAARLAGYECSTPDQFCHNRRPFLSCKG